MLTSLQFCSIFSLGFLHFACCSPYLFIFLPPLAAPFLGAVFLWVLKGVFLDKVINLIFSDLNDLPDCLCSNILAN